MQIELGASDIIVRQCAQAVERLFDRHFAGFYLFEELFESLGIHKNLGLETRGIQTRSHFSRRDSFDCLYIVFLFKTAFMLPVR